MKNFLMYFPLRKPNSIGASGHKSRTSKTKNFLLNILATSPGIATEIGGELEITTSNFSEIAKYIEIIE